MQNVFMLSKMLQLQTKIPGSSDESCTILEVSPDARQRTSETILSSTLLEPAVVSPAKFHRNRSSCFPLHVR